MADPANTDDARSLGQYFFEQGFFACFAEAMAANDGNIPFEPSDKMMDQKWDATKIARDDYDEFDARLALADAAPEMLAALVEILGPLNVCTDNPNVCDDEILPVDMTMGELRRARAAISKATSRQPEGER